MSETTNEIVGIVEEKKTETMSEKAGKWIGEHPIATSLIVTVLGTALGSAAAWGVTKTLDCVSSKVTSYRTYDVVDAIDVPDVSVTDQS